MRVITDQHDLQQCHSVEHGYIYNDYSGPNAGGEEFNILHMASCSTLAPAKADTPHGKYFTNDLGVALAWLNANRRENWHRCPVCAP